MNVLVTGTAGFIGMHVAMHLLERGDTVVGFDNFNDYYPVGIKEARNRRLEEYARFTCVRGDLQNSDAVNELFADHTFDVVVNLAAQAGVRYSLINPHSYIDSNIVGFINILEACRHNGIPRLVYASSSSVYGGNQKVPFSEQDRVDTPVSLYAATKKSNELMAHCYTHLYGFQTVGLRFFTVYGPWGRPDMALWLFTDSILNKKPIDVFNRGDMKRSFTYIDDIVKGVVASIDKPHLKPCEVFNLGNHRTENLLEMIEIVEECLGDKAEKNFLPMQPGDVKVTYADTEYAREKLGFVPSTPIKEGIPQFVQWFKEYHGLDEGSDSRLADADNQDTRCVSEFVPSAAASLIGKNSERVSDQVIRELLHPIFQRNGVLKAVLADGSVESSESSNNIDLLIVQETGRHSMERLEDFRDIYEALKGVAVQMMVFTPKELEAVDTRNAAWHLLQSGRVIYGA
ncbi:MAG: NAD-dependent epimerase [Chitinivibrionales bacterium]